MIDKKYRTNVLVICLSVALLFASLWQLEIIYIWNSEGRTVFEFPFYVFTTNLATGRDFWYAMNVLAFLLIFWAAASFPKEGK